MSVEAQHSYRFGYLKSEQWSTVRLEALAREDAKCQICGERNLSNDAHHKWYPENIYETTADQLVILCRPCHDFIHTVMPDCKTGDEKTGREIWTKFSNAITTWRHGKALLFHEEQYSKYGLEFDIPSKHLRVMLRKMKEENPERYGMIIPKKEKQHPMQPMTPRIELRMVIRILRKWYKAFSPDGTTGEVDRIETNGVEMD